MVASLAKMEVRCLYVTFIYLTFTIFTSSAIDSREPSANFINKHRPSSNNLDWSMTASADTGDTDLTPDTDSSENSRMFQTDDRISRRAAWRMIGRRSLEDPSGPDDVISTAGDAIQSRNRRGASNHQSFFVRIGRRSASNDDIRSGGPRHRRSHVMTSDRTFDGGDERWVMYDQNEDAVKRGVDDGFEKRGPNSFIRLGRSQAVHEDEVKRGPNSFIRLGRSRENDDAIKQAVSEDEYVVKRGPNSFIRLGRSRNYQGQNEGTEDIVKRGPNSFIRLGRSRDFLLGSKNSLGLKDDIDVKRGPNSFIRLGRSQSDESSQEQTGNAKASDVANELDQVSLQHQLLIKNEKSAEIDKRGPNTFMKIGRRSTNED